MLYGQPFEIRSRFWHLDRNYRYKSIAVQIHNEAGLVLIPNTSQKLLPYRGWRFMRQFTKTESFKRIQLYDELDVDSSRQVYLDIGALG